MSIYGIFSPQGTVHRYFQQCTEASGFQTDVNAKKGFKFCGEVQFWFGYTFDGQLAQ